MSRSNDEKLLWHEWNPGLDNDQWTLGYVLETMPRVEASKIPLSIRLFENPASPIALPGAISLERHDAIHALLGRGLRVQDEAFVIGFTMGAASDLKNRHIGLFAFISSYIYRKPYKFTPRDIMIFRMGVWEAKVQKCENLHQFAFENHHDKTLRELRDQLGIDRNRLYSLYSYEKVLLPDTKASRRLDHDYMNTDHSAIHHKDHKGQENKP